MIFLFVVCIAEGNRSKKRTMVVMVAPPRQLRNQLRIAAPPVPQPWPNRERQGLECRIPPPTHMKDVQTEIHGGTYEDLVLGRTALENLQYAHYMLSRTPHRFYSSSWEKKRSEVLQFIKNWHVTFYDFISPLPEVQPCK